MQISIEVPVFKGRFLRPCIDSVLAQTSRAWTLSLLWDGGDRESRAILEQLQQEEHSRVQVHFANNRGIAAARRFISAHSQGEYILPLDDDDVLPPGAVERFLRAATQYPWASLIRGRRNFIDVDGAMVNEEPWFPFGPRNYEFGMVTDLFNQAQPYLIRRSAYDRTQGWTGFADFMGAGEDCDIFLQLEEVAHFELVDEVLYHYRLHDRRASHTLTSAAAFEMWRRLADRALARMGLPLERVNDAPPFQYRSLPRPTATLEDVDFVVQGAGGIATESLRRCGIALDAVHETAAVANPSTWRMAGFRATKRRLVCFFEEHMEIQTRSALETLVRALDDGPADLLSPRPSQRSGGCLLVRREVIAATGGFDDCYVPASLQEADLWIQAQRRRFRCAEFPVAGIESRGSFEPHRTAAETAMLRSKWQSHPALLEP